MAMSVRVRGGRVRPPQSRIEYTQAQDVTKADPFLWRSRLQVRGSQGAANMLYVAKLRKDMIISGFVAPAAMFYPPLIATFMEGSATPFIARSTQM